MPLVVGIGIRDIALGNYLCVMMLLKGATSRCSSGLSRRDFDGLPEHVPLPPKVGTWKCFPGLMLGDVAEVRRCVLKGWEVYGSVYVGSSERLLVASRFDTVSISR